MTAALEPGPGAAGALDAAAAAHDAQAAALEAAAMAGEPVSLSEVDEHRALARAARWRGRAAAAASDRAAGAARAEALTVLAGDIAGYAASCDVAARTAGLLATIAEASAAITALAAAHDGAAGVLYGRAVALGVPPMPPGGPRAGDQGVAVTGRRPAARGVALALYGQGTGLAEAAAAGARPAVPPAVAPLVPAARPGMLAVSGSGVVIDIGGDPARYAGQLAKGDLVVLDGHCVDEWMAGALALEAAHVGALRAAQVTRLGAEREGARVRAVADGEAAWAAMGGQWA